jgi:hypothetical protein
VRRPVVAMTPMMDSAAGRSVRLRTSASPGRGVGADGSNSPSTSYRITWLTTRAIATADAGRWYSGLLIECSDGVRWARGFGGVLRGG